MSKGIGLKESCGPLGLRTRVLRICPLVRERGQSLLTFPLTFNLVTYATFVKRL